MKTYAVIHFPKYYKGAYRHLRGTECEVVRYSDRFVTLLIDGKEVDFTRDEVMIFQK